MLKKIVVGYNFSLPQGYSYYVGQFPIYWLGQFPRCKEIPETPYRKIECQSGRYACWFHHFLQQMEDKKAVGSSREFLLKSTLMTTGFKRI